MHPTHLLICAQVLEQELRREKVGEKEAGPLAQAVARSSCKRRVEAEEEGGRVRRALDGLDAHHDRARPRLNTPGEADARGCEGDADHR